MVVPTVSANGTVWYWYLETHRPGCAEIVPGKRRELVRCSETAPGSVAEVLQSQPVQSADTVIRNGRKSGSESDAGYLMILQVAEAAGPPPCCC